MAWKSDSSRKTAEQRSAASERHDAQYMRDRKTKEAANVARTLELKALRLAKEAQERAERDSQPAPIRRKKRVAV
jgi:membrane-associated HD superfamily phosphohydrolase